MSKIMIHLISKLKVVKITIITYNKPFVTWNLEVKEV